MTTLKFMTWNVRGVRNKIKRTAALAFLKAQKANVIALTETHATGHLQSALKRPWVGWAYHSTHTNLSRGVSLLVTKSTPFELISVKTDVVGRYVFALVKLGGSPMLLIVCYIPPHIAQRSSRRDWPIWHNIRRCRQCGWGIST